MDEQATEVLVAATVATPMAPGESISIPLGQTFQISEGLDGRNWLVVDLLEEDSD